MAGLDYLALADRVGQWLNITPNNRADLLTALRQAAREREALGTLVARLDEVMGHEQYIAPLVFAAAHGYEYTGPTWTAELNAARAALLKEDGKDDEREHRTMSIQDDCGQPLEVRDGKLQPVQAGEASLLLYRAKAVLAEYADELAREACDECEECGKLSMCMGHSILSLLTGGSLPTRKAAARIAAPKEDMHLIDNTGVLRSWADTLRKWSKGKSKNMRIKLAARHLQDIAQELELAVLRFQAIAAREEDPDDQA